MFGSGNEIDYVAIMSLIVETMTLIFVAKNYWDGLYTDSKNETKTK